MNRVQKKAIIEELTEKFSNTNFFYLTDSSTLNVEDINKLRRICFEKNIEIRVVKNTLIRKALEAVEGKEYDESLLNELKGPTTLMFAEHANEPAKLVKEFRKEHEKPLIKAAYVEESVYVGDEQLDALAALKSKKELIGDVILLLESPIKNVISGLNSGGDTLARLLQAIEERGAA